MRCCRQGASSPMILSPPGLVAVAVLALVGAGVVAEVSGSTVAGDGAAGHLGHCWGVVRCIEEGGIADIVGVSH